jgi:hypothetical protein
MVISGIDSRSEILALLTDRGELRYSEVIAGVPSCKSPFFHLSRLTASGLVKKLENGRHIAVNP